MVLEHLERCGRGTIRAGCVVTEVVLSATASPIGGCGVSKWGGVEEARWGVAEEVRRGGVEEAHRGGLE